MKVDYICTQWPLGPDKGPSAASRLASCVFLISYCFSQREGHLLIDCLNPLQINTAGSLCDAYPSSPSSPCLEQARGWGREGEEGVVVVKRLHQINPHFLTQALSLSQHLFHCLFCVYFMSISSYHRNPNEWNEEIHTRRYPHIGALTPFMSCEMNQGYLTSQPPDSTGVCQHFLLFWQQEGSLGIDKWLNTMKV